MSDFVYHHPMSKTIRNDEENNTKIICEIGDIAFMCPECFHMVETNIGYSKVIQNILDKIEGFTSTNEYGGMCPNCKEYVKFEPIDINMAKTINILNTKGYYTVFCCEGYIGPDDYTGEEEVTLSYVYFYLWDDADVLQSNPLPNTWYLPDDDKECNIFSIRDNIINEMPKSIINGNEIHDPVAYNGWLKRHWNREERIKDLYNWAVSLPDKDKFLKEAQRNFVKEYGHLILLKNSEKTIEYQNRE